MTAEQARKKGAHAPRSSCLKAPARRPHRPVGTPRCRALYISRSTFCGEATRHTWRGAKFRCHMTRAMHVVLHRMGSVTHRNDTGPHNSLREKRRMPPPTTKRPLKRREGGAEPPAPLLLLGLEAEGAHRGAARFEMDLAAEVDLEELAGARLWSGETSSEGGPRTILALAMVEPASLRGAPFDAIEART